MKRYYKQNKLLTEENGLLNEQNELFDRQNELLNEQNELKKNDVKNFHFKLFNDSFFTEQ